MMVMRKSQNAAETASAPKANISTFNKSAINPPKPWPEIKTREISKYYTYISTSKSKMQ